MKIVLIPFEKIGILAELKTELSKILNSDIKIYPDVPGANARERVVSYRKQLNAEDFIPVIGKIVNNEGSGYALGVTNRDLYVPGLNFVFGLASLINRACVISLARLVDKDEDLYLSRVVKEAVHELGHLFGMQHCDNARCVMHFSNCLAGTDYKREIFCKGCEPKCKKSKRILKK